MVINPDLTHFANANGLDDEFVKLFAFAVEYDCLNSFFEFNALKKEDLEFLRINLCDMDLGSNDMILKIPLFAIVRDSEFQALMSLLTTKDSIYSMTSAGHKQNLKKYSVLSTGKETEALFNKIHLELSTEYKREKMAKVISEYYRKTGYPIKLQNYLEKQAVMDYRSYNEELEWSNPDGVML